MVQELLLIQIIIALPVITSAIDVMEVQVLNVILVEIFIGFNLIQIIV